MAKLNELHKNHERDLNAITSALESEAERQRRELQERLKNRRKKRLKECEGANMMDEEIERVDRTMREEAELELARFDLKSSQRNSNVVNGVKKAHVKIIEQFTDDDNEDSYNDIANKLARELREAHLKDLVKMRDQVETERERQRRALQERLRKKRLSKLNSNDDGEDAKKIIMDIDFEEQTELAALEEKFSSKIRDMTHEPTEYFAANCLGSRLGELNEEGAENAEDWMGHLGE